jgi:hypothetical protein
LGVIETQGRGSLHIHFAIWTKISSESLEAVSHDAIIAKKLSKVLDSMTCASVPLSFHIQRKNRDCNRRYGFEESTIDPDDENFETKIELPSTRQRNGSSVSISQPFENLSKGEIW